MDQLQVGSYLGGHVPDLFIDGSITLDPYPTHVVMGQIWPDPSEIFFILNFFKPVFKRQMLGSILHAC